MIKKIKIATIILSILAIDQFSCASDMLQGTIFPTQQASTEQPFQPADGSLDNGNYDATQNTAKTRLHFYINVVAVDGTTIIPTLTAAGKYIDKNGNQLDAIGSYSLYSSDLGYDKTYYLFGTPIDQATPIEALKNEPIETYNSREE